ncbi:hypothetical protein [Aquibacillus rhizosphaerae]|uniref:Uncharacterized protein n=1 Tax=Aquibacillus rhizosphaerae TaxID=3051431 RepID=A0ABT7L0P5_9BACI|nr:hypothetical protein [Aquibacillus sp. LR5S19]MDL4839409.1 hypothetical protein [Aquibacillus sp. LR5S19]
MNVDYGPALGMYIIGLGLVKGYRSEELTDVFNFKKTKDLYKKINFKDSLMEYLSLFLVFLNSLLIGNTSYTAFEYIWVFFLVATVHRFLFWGITRAIRIGTNFTI